MLIDCPHCAHSRHIARASLGAGLRKLRCAACREIFQLNLDELVAPGSESFADSRVMRKMQPEVSPDPPVEIVAQATSARAAPPTAEEIYGEIRSQPESRSASKWRIPRPKLPRPSRGIVAAVAVIGLCMASIGLRQSIVRFAPGTAGAYARIGLPVNLRGLELRHVTTTLIGDKDQRLLAVEGEIANLAKDTANLPMLSLSVRNARGQEIYAWTTQPPRASVAAAQTVPFRARLASPPEGAQDVVVRFAPLGVASREARQ